MPYWWRPLRGLQLEGGRSVHKELEETDRGQGGEKESHSQVCSGGQESARAQVQLPWTPPPTHTHTQASSGGYGSFTKGFRPHSSMYMGGPQEREQVGNFLILHVLC